LIGKRMSIRGMLEKIGKSIRFILKKENKEIRKKTSAYILTVFVFFIMFASLAGNLIYFLETQSYDAIGSEFNKRQELLEERNIRGDIITRNGDILAYSEQGEGDEEERIYPYGPLFSHVVGFSTNGKMGIEKYANMNLIQSNDSVDKRVSNNIKQEKNKGDTVVSTLNYRLQEVAFKSLGAYKGAVIVTDVKSGAILAMVSKPDFDPNLIEKEWEKLLLDEESSVLVNRVTQGMYPPGSTFKIIDALAYYQQFPEEVEQYRYQCNGRFMYEDRKITCYHGTQHGMVDIRSSFAKSCNSSFANIGLMLDRKQFAKTLEDLLFGKELPGDMVHNQSEIFLDENSDDTTVVQASIGQGKSSMSPYHLNLITSAIANDGVLMKPFLIHEIRNSSGKTVKKYEPEKELQLLTSKEALFLQDLMTEVVENGTGHRLQEASYTSAGKTGSAEFGTNPADSHAWFTGFAPADDPKVAVTIIIEGAGTGGDYAVPVAKRLFDVYFEQFPQN